MEKESGGSGGDSERNAVNPGPELCVVKVEEDFGYYNGTGNTQMMVKFDNDLIQGFDPTEVAVKVEDSDIESDDSEMYNTDSEASDSAVDIERSDENFIYIDGVLKIEESSETLEEQLNPTPPLTHPMHRFRQLHSNVYSDLPVRNIITSYDVNDNTGLLQNLLTGNTRTTNTAPKPVLTEEESASVQNIIERPYQCSVCGAGSRSISDLKKHFAIHNNGKRYMCDFCGKGLRTSSDLTKHVRTHTKEKPYQCPHCPKAFTEKGNMVNHIRTHTQEKPYTCEECGRGFAEKKTLRDHRRTHTGEKPYKCGVCGKCFAQNSHLNRHVFTHDKVKPFPCQECEKSYTDRSKLKRHSLTHRKR